MSQTSLISGSFKQPSPFVFKAAIGALFAVVWASSLLGFGSYMEVEDDFVFGGDTLPSTGKKLPLPQTGRFDVEETIKAVFDVELPSDRVFVAGDDRDWGELQVGPLDGPDPRGEVALGASASISLKITRYVGRIDSMGRLTSAGTMIQKKLLKRKAILLLSHGDYDANYVDSAGKTCCDTGWTDDADAGLGLDILPDPGNPIADCESGCPECRDVYVNGERVPLLAISGYGDVSPSEMTAADSWDQKWVLAAYEVNVEDLIFPEPGTDGQPPSGGVNTIRVRMGAGGARPNLGG